MSLPLRSEIVVAFKRFRRSFTDDEVHAFFLLFGVGAGAVILVGRVPGFALFDVGPGAYLHGRRLGDGTLQSLAAARRLSTYAFSLLVVIGVFKRVGSGEFSTHHGFQLLATTPGAVAVAEWIRDVIEPAVTVVPVLWLGAVTFAVGAGRPLVAVTLAVSVVALVVTATTAGLAIGVVVQYLMLEVGWLRRYSRAFGLVALSAFTGGMIAVSRGVGPSLPVGWYADLGLLVVPVGASPAHGIGVLVASLLVAVGSMRSVRRLGPTVWLGESDADANRTTDGRLAGALEAVGVVSPAAAGVAATVWRRLSRNPKGLLLVPFLVAITASSLVPLIDRQPAVVPLVVAVYGATAVTIGPPLNVIGNEGRVRPLARTTPGGVRAVVVGYALAGVVPGVLLVPAFVATVGVLASLSVGMIVGWVVVGLALAVAAPFVAVLAGTYLPQFEGIDATTASGTEPPDLQAIVLVALPTLAVAQPATAGLIGGGFLTGFGVPRWLGPAVGVGASVGLAGWLARWAREQAVERLDDAEH